MTTAVTGEPRTGTPLDYKALLAPYARPSLGRSLLDLATSLVPYLALSVAMYHLLDVSYWLVLALAVPAGGFLLRTYIIFHDCTHGSFMPSKRANKWLGRALGVVVYSAFTNWRHDHAVHHATAGDLDRRGTGDVMTWTVAEYHAKPWLSRMGYRLFRNPLVMFGIGPLYALALRPRVPSRKQRPRIFRSVMLTNLALVAVIGALCWWIGWEAFVAVQLPTTLLAATAGVFLFYVQHQFEDVYWSESDHWDFADAALRGSSYLKLPKVLQFFTGNIGFHHIHHLSARIPNYNLQRAHDDNPRLQEVPTLTLWQGLRCVRWKLWSDEMGRLVTWREAQVLRR